MTGNFNARVGNDTSIWGDVIGSHGEEVCNENGRRLLQFSSEHNLIIANTCFPHKKIHMYTWECRGRGLMSLIDYFLIRKGDRKQVATRCEGSERCRNWKRSLPGTYED